MEDHAREPSPDLDWQDGVPVSRRHDDAYYARDDGLAESVHVYLGGCGLPGAWQGRSRFGVAELGFGTGLNFCATLAAWRATAAQDARLDYTGFEIAPLDAAQMARALARWPCLAAEAGSLTAAWTGRDGTLTFGLVRLRLVTGDARRTVPGWAAAADAWYLDGFAPARNPEMWEAPLLSAVHARTVPGGRAATFTAAGHVRRALAAAGFEVERRPGHGRKRHMTVARRRA